MPAPKHTRASSRQTTTAMPASTEGLPVTTEGTPAPTEDTPAIPEDTATSQPSFTTATLETHSGPAEDLLMMPEDTEEDGAIYEDDPSQYPNTSANEVDAEEALMHSEADQHAPAAVGGTEASMHAVRPDAPGMLLNSHQPVGKVLYLLRGPHAFFGFLNYTTSTAISRKVFGTLPPHKTEADSNRFPHLPFYDLPSSGTTFDRPNTANHIDPGLHRWEVPSDVDIRNPLITAEILGLIYATIHQHCHNLGFTAEDIAHWWPNGVGRCHTINRRKYVDIPWPADAPVVDSLPVRFRTRTLKWHGRGPICPPWLCTIDVQTSPMTPVKQLVEALTDALAPNATLIDLWQCHTGMPAMYKSMTGMLAPPAPDVSVDEPTDQSASTSFTAEPTFIPPKHLLQFAGRWLALIALVDRNGKPHPSPATAREALPGYLHLDATQYLLEYPDRRPWCRICRPCTEAEYHTRATCPRLKCPHCGTDGDHFPSACSKHPRARKRIRQNDGTAQPVINTAGFTRD